MEDLRYPIGQCQFAPFSTTQLDRWLNDLWFLPDELEIAVQTLDAAQLDTPYREGGWTVREVVHHVADSHINAYMRFKLCLTEDTPAIKTYEEQDWAKLDDVQTVPTNISLTLLHALHQRWVAAIKNLPAAVWETRMVYHPGQQKNVSLWQLLAMYAWHGKHHVAHITALKERRGWN